MSAVGRRYAKALLECCDKCEQSRDYYHEAADKLGNETVAGAVYNLTAVVCEFNRSVLALVALGYSVKRAARRREQETLN